jgi:hypothetical protein
MAPICNRCQRINGTDYNRANGTDYKSAPAVIVLKILRQPEPGYKDQQSNKKKESQQDIKR